MTPASEASHCVQSSRQVSNPLESIDGVRLLWKTKCAPHCGQRTAQAPRAWALLSLLVSSRRAELAMASTIALRAGNSPRAAFIVEGWKQSLPAIGRILRFALSFG